jgi:hypothetical protein
VTKQYKQEIQQNQQELPESSNIGFEWKNVQEHSFTESRRNFGGGKKKTFIQIKILKIWDNKIQ